MNRLQSEPVFEKEANPIEEFIGKMTQQEDGEMSFGKKDRQTDGRRQAVNFRKSGKNLN